MFDHFHYRNIYVGRYTSVAGVAIIIVACYMLVAGKASLTEGAPLLLTGFGLLGTKDPGRTKSKRKPTHDEQSGKSR